MVWWHGRQKGEKFSYSQKYPRQNEKKSELVRVPTEQRAPSHPFTAFSPRIQPHSASAWQPEEVAGGHKNLSAAAVR
ncbi:unnamed protein product [Victoria cruziana]